MNWLKNLILLMLVNLRKRDYDDKITDVEGNISDITNLPTATILTPVENKTLNANDLVKKSRL